VSGVVVWVTGKPSSGKSTFAREICSALEREGTCSTLLDGDDVRSALTPAPGYDPKSRDEFYATLANLAALLARQGAVVLVAATAHLAEFRRRARSVAPAFVEVWVDVPSSELEARDAKGLYAAVREGRASGVPGADLAYETPERADVIVKGGLDSIGLEAVLNSIREKLVGG
jgi:adenylylsulfate kinase